MLPKNLALYIMISGQKMAKTTDRNTVGLDNGHIWTQPAIKTHAEWSILAI